MTVVTWDFFRAAEHFIMRSARLIDRHRFAHHFQNGPTDPVHSALSAYRNLDGGYGNALHPDLRGHTSQPTAAAIALDYLDELGSIPTSLGNGLCRYLTTVSNPDGGLPPVRPTVRYTESAPWWQHHEDPSGSLALTASITGNLHKHRITHPWRDKATAYCWKHIEALHWTNPREAIGVCTFLEHAPDRRRATHNLNRLHPMIRAVIHTSPEPATRQRIHTPLDLAANPSHIARPLFTDTEINHNLNYIEKTQRPDGGWDSPWEHWDAAATIEHEGMCTIQRLCVLHAYGRIAAFLPPPRKDH